MLIGIAADDLTSATDGAVSFVNAGHACEVCFDYRFATLPKSGVLSIDKDSRSRSSAEAEKRAEAVTLKFAGVDVLYQTTDSTIRGHLEAEILAALTASGRKVALLAPAFPEAGRTTEGGEQKLNGKPMNMTLFGRDPIHPVRQSRIRKLFPGMADNDIRHLGLPEIRALQPFNFTAGAHRLVIADAITQADLDRLVAAVDDPREVLFCGSPGMARALASRFRGACSNSLVLPKVTMLLAVVGSANFQSASQKRWLLTSENSVEIIIDPKAASVSPIAAARAALDKAKPLMAEAKTLVLATGLIEKIGVDPVKITEALAHAAAEIVRSHAVDGLILTGGDTAAAVFKALHVPSLKLASEIEPGIPFGMIEHPRPMAVLTKAGGFGTLEVLANAAKVMRLGNQGKAV